MNSEFQLQPICSYFILPPLAMSFYLWSGFASKFCDVSEFCDAQASLLPNSKLCLCCQLSWMSQHPGHAVSNLIADNSTFWHLCLSVSRFLLLG